MQANQAVLMPGSRTGESEFAAEERLRVEDEARIVETFREDIEFLRDVPMFAGLEYIELARLCQIAAIRTYPRESVLLEEGQLNDSLCLIRRGTVELVSHRTNGQPFLTLGRGRFFGQVSMFNPSPASASVIARTSVEVFCVRERPLCDLLIAYPEVGVRLLAAIIRDLAKRHQTMIQRFREFSPSVAAFDQ